MEERWLCWGPVSFSFLVVLAILPLLVVLAIRIVESVRIPHVALLTPRSICYVSRDSQLFPLALMLAACLLLGCYVPSSIYRRRGEHGFQAPGFHTRYSSSYLSLMKL